MKNIWKYLFLLGGVNLIGTLIYCFIIILTLGGDTKVPHWFEVWFISSMICLVLSALLATIGNLKEIWNDLKYFLK